MRERLGWLKRRTDGLKPLYHLTVGLPVLYACLVGEGAAEEPTRPGLTATTAGRATSEAETSSPGDGGVIIWPTRRPGRAQGTRSEIALAAPEHVRSGSRLPEAGT
jgi:hypothetical protein